MRKELNAGTVKVSSQSMPNLTNIFRIGCDVVKSNIYHDDKESSVIRSSCTTKLSVNRKKRDAEYFITIFN